MTLSLPRLSVAAALLALAAAAAFMPSARSQIHATPSLLPIGVASSGTSSMVWFHEPSSGKVVACQSTGGSSLTGVQCAVGKLP
ncbi:MAG: hypothetical protein ABI433_11060 [Burkholderiaceae bacterium]